MLSASKTNNQDDAYMKKLIPLRKWAEMQFSSPPTIRTLRRWVRDGRISPQPILVGREYQVNEDAVYVPKPEKYQPLDLITSNTSDPVVNEIIYG